MAEKWKDIFVDYTQDTSMHGVRYTTLSTAKIRRAIWTLVVLGGLSVFIYLAISRMLYMLTNPKAVSVEVSFSDTLEFPAVTICNQNLFRLTALQQLGLYDLFEAKLAPGGDQMSVYGFSKNESIQGCEETFYRTTDGCLLDKKYWNDNTHVFVEVSLSVCTHLCLNVHTKTCSLLQYSGKRRTCVLTQNRAIPQDNQNCEAAIRLRRTRCPAYARFICDFEDDISICPLLGSDDSAHLVGSHWHHTTAGLTFTGSDYSAKSVNGNHVVLFTETEADNRLYEMRTDLMDTTGICFEFYHRATAGKIMLMVEDQDLRKTTLHTAHAMNVWTRTGVALPLGLNRIIIAATGADAKFAVDDVTSADILRHQMGIGYAGTRAVSRTGKTCRAWEKQIGPNITRVSRGGEALTENYCRNFFLLDEGPGCFTEPNGEYETCDIPFRECRPYESRCDSGQCISEELLCDMNPDCNDGSDEANVCDHLRSIPCTFSDTIRCGYTESEHSSPGLTWLEAEGFMDIFVPPNSKTRYKGTYLRLESYLGNFGAKTWLISPMGNFGDDCLEFLLLMKHRAGYQGLPHITVYKTKDGEDLNGINIIPMFFYDGHLDGLWRLVKFPLPRGQYKLLFQFATDGEDAGITNITTYPGKCKGFSHIKGDVYNQSLVEPVRISTNNHFYILDSEWESHISNDPEPTRTVDGELCSLPFIYQGQKYDTCIPDPQAMGQLWCSLTPNYDVEQQKKFCYNGNYIKTVGGTGEGKPCVFPFSFDGREYYSCITAIDGYYWCGTVADSSKWGKCVIEKEMQIYIPYNTQPVRNGWCQDVYNYKGQNYAGCNIFGEYEELSCAADTDAYLVGRCVDDCGGYYTSKRGTIQSPRFKGSDSPEYPNNIDCAYVIEQPLGTDINLEFLTFDTEYASDCSYDFLEIRSGNSHDAPILQRFCGGESPEPILNAGHVLYIHFSSDYAVPASGFSIRYTTSISNDTVQVKEVVKYISPGYKLLSPVTFNYLAEEVNVTEKSCIQVTVNSIPSISVHLRTTKNVGVKGAKFTQVSEQLTRRFVSWTVDPGAYQLYLVGVRSSTTVAYVDSVLTETLLTPGTCADLVIPDSSLSCNFFYGRSCGYIDDSPGKVNFILDEHLAGEAMVARIPKGTINAKLRLISQQAILTSRVKLKVLFEFHSAEPDLEYNTQEVALKNLANDSYTLGTVTVTNGGAAWSRTACVMVEPGVMRLRISFSSSTAGNLSVAEVAVGSGQCGTEQKNDSSSAGYSGDIWCDFEDSSRYSCPFQPSIPFPGQQSWLISQASFSSINADHTTGSRTGVQATLFPRFPLDNSTHSLYTALWKTSNMCLQFWYRTVGSLSCYLTVRATDPATVNGTSILLLHTNQTVDEWKRVFVSLPEGSNIISIEAQRHSDKVGIAVDDLMMRDCSDFDESRITEFAVEYQGKINKSRSGDPCLPWDSLGAIGPVPWGGGSLTGHNYCRNLFLLADGPGCFTDMSGTYQLCDISYEACRPGYFTCSSGRCIPNSRVCDGEKNCLDASDEYCSSQNTFTSGPWENYKMSPFSAEHIKFNSSGSELLLHVDDTRVGDRIWLLGPSGTYNAGCLTIQIKMEKHPLIPTLPTLEVLTISDDLDDPGDLIDARPLLSYSEFPDDQYHTLEVPAPGGAHRFVYQFTLGTEMISINSITFADGACSGSASVTGSSITANIELFSNSKFYEWSEGWDTLGIMDECKETEAGQSFTGYKSTTKSGRRCQPWTSSSPHSKGPMYEKLSSYHDTSFAVLGNKCRNPDNEPSPWCYTMDPNIRWEECHLPLCGKTQTVETGYKCATQSYRGATRSECVFTDGYPFWCYTDPDQTTWRYCTSKAKGYRLRTLVTGDSLGEECYFPFRYNNTLYTTCDKLGGLTPQCAVGDPKVLDANRFGTCVSACGGFFTQKSGYFRSPVLYGDRIGSVYPNNAACVYQIEQEIGHRINLTFQSFDVHNDSSCDDYIEVRDGLKPTDNLLYKSCDSEVPAFITSTGNTMFVLFHSKDNVAGVGFLAMYTSYAYNPSLADHFKQDAFLSGEFRFIDPAMDYNNRWLLVKLADVTGPSCVTIDYIYKGTLEVFWKTGSEKKVIASCSSPSYKIKHQELNIKISGSHKLYMKTAYKASTDPGVSFLLRSLNVSGSTCNYGYQALVGDNVGGEVTSLVQKTVSPSVDSCLLVPYIFKVETYFAIMPQYKIWIKNQDGLLKTVELNEIFNRTSSIKGKVQVNLPAGTHNINVEVMSISNAQIGIDNLKVETGSCLSDIPVCTPFASGRGYAGIQDRTESGRKCARGSGHNYNLCSNSGNKRHATLWCYLEMDPNTYEMCDVPVCSTLKVISDNSCRMDLRGEKYAGSTNLTAKGNPCVPWSGIPSNHTDIEDLVENFPEGNLTKAKNFCRNPGGWYHIPWCYINKEYTEKENCWIPYCNDSPYKVCQEYGVLYTGQWNIPKSGSKCQLWASSSPHSHGYVSEEFPEDSLALAENYCRTLDEPRPWCYTVDPGVRWDFCDIPTCPSIYTTSGDLCSVPFIYEGNSYSGCLLKNDDNNKYWCSLTPNFDEDGEWGYCESQSPLRLVPESGVEQNTTIAGTTSKDTSTITQTPVQSSTVDPLPDDLTKHPSQNIFYGSYLESLGVLNNMSFLFEFAGHRLKEAVVSCTWNSGSCDDYMASLLTDSGQCISFNHNFDERLNTAKTGATFGLRLTMDTQQYDYMVGPNTDAGIKVYLHDQRDVPMVRNLGFAISTGLHGLVAAKLSSYLTLPKPHGECLKDEDLEPEHGANYTLSKCKRKCETQYTDRKCGCVDTYMPKENYQDCNMSTYLDCIIPLTFRSGILEECDFECPDQCIKSTYSAELSYSSLSGTSLDLELSKSGGQEAERFIHSKEVRERVDYKAFSKTISLLNDVTQTYQVLLDGGLIYAVNALNMVAMAASNIVSLVASDVLLTLGPCLTKLRASYQVTLGPLYDQIFFDLDDVSTSMTRLQVKYHKPGRTSLINDTLELENLKYSIEDLEMMFVNISSPGTYNRTGDIWKIVSRYPSNGDGAKACAELELHMKNKIASLKQEAAKDFPSLTILMSHHKEIISRNTEFKNCLLKYQNQIVLMEQKYEEFQAVHSAMVANMHAAVSAFATLSIDTVISQLTDIEKTSHEVLQSYGQNETTKVELAALMLSNLTSIEELECFVKELKAGKQLISDLIVDVMQKTATLYLETVNGLTLLEMHLDGTPVEDKYLRKMYIWLMPYLSEEVDISLEFGATDETQVWPASRRTSGFMRVRGLEYLQDIQRHFTDGFIKYVERAVTNVVTLYATLNNKITSLEGNLNDFLESVQIDESFSLKNFLQVDVFFSQLKYEKVTQIKSYELPNYLSEIGGYMGLLIGASAITLIEVFDLIIFNVCRKLAKLKKVQPTPSTTNIYVTPTPEAEKA